MRNFISPEAASTFALPVDLLFYGLVGLTIFFTVGIALAILIMVVKYRRKHEDQVGMSIVESKWLEITWTVIPLIISMGIFFVGAKLYLSMREMPKDVLEISVVGKQWMWKFQHPDGRREINTLHIPVGRAIQLRMISQDVIHSVFVPAFRIKQDAVPMYYTSTWFEATKIGEYNLHCTEYCGKDHSIMGGKVYVMSAADYEAWLTSGGPSGFGGIGGASGADAGAAVATKTAADQGAELFTSMACITCHGGSNRGPSLNGLFGSKVLLEGGKTVKADENYIRKSILNPTADIVKGYQPQMPAFQGLVTEEQINQLIAYIKSLGKQK